MAALRAIIIKPEWYEDLKGGLEEIKKRTTKKSMRIVASTALKTLEMGKRKFDKGEWDQLVFTTKEAKFLEVLSDTLGMDDAAKRFGAKPTRV